MDNSLIDYLKQIPDFRRTAGLRHPQWLILLLIIMSIMSGKYGYRGIGRFIERHRRALIEQLSLPKARVPSYSTIRRSMIGLNYKEIEEKFNQWASQYGNLAESEWVSIDGKALKNTVTDYDQAEQNFINVVSAFSHQRGIVLGVKVIENKKTSEIKAVQELLSRLDLEGVVFTLDALHCQKKPWMRLSVEAMTM